MNMFYHFWKVWLCPNHSTTNNICQAEVATRRLIKRNEEIAEQLVLDTDVSYNTLIYIINQYDRVLREMLCEGFTVKTSNLELTPKVLGNWDSKQTMFSPEEHQLTIDCKATDEIRKALELVGVDVLGIKSSSSSITQVTDRTSGKVDSILTRNGEIVIEGKGIKAIGKDGTGRNCIFLIKSNKIMVDIGERDLLKNDRDQLIIHLPKSVEKGQYYLVIQTYFTEKNDATQEMLHCIEFDKILTVK